MLAKIGYFFLGVAIILLIILWVVVWLVMDVIISPLVGAVWFMAFIDRKNNKEEYERVIRNIVDLLELTFLPFGLG